MKNKTYENKIQIHHSCRVSFGAVICAGAVLLVAPGAQAQNLFVSDYISSGPVYEFTPGGAQSTFATGLNGSWGLAFDSTGNLFEADALSDHIYRFTSGGARSTFASGLSFPDALAFNRAGNLFEGDLNSGNIYEFTPGGTRSTFAAGLNHPNALAFNSAGNLFEADFASGNIYEFMPDGVQNIFATGLPCSLLNWPFRAKPCPCLSRPP
jgi:sugar lactone lactonase YvrE